MRSLWKRFNAGFGGARKPRCLSYRRVTPARKAVEISKNLLGAGPMGRSDTARQTEYKVRTSDARRGMRIRWLCGWALFGCGNGNLRSVGTEARFRRIGRREKNHDATGFYEA